MTLAQKIFWSYSFDRAEADGLSLYHGNLAQSGWSAEEQALASRLLAVSTDDGEYQELDPEYLVNLVEAATLEQRQRLLRALLKAVPDLSFLPEDPAKALNMATGTP